MERGAYFADTSCSEGFDLLDLGSCVGHWGGGDGGEGEREEESKRSEREADHFCLGLFLSSWFW